MYVSRKLLTIRSSMPDVAPSLVTPVYLGMPPLSIGYGKPLSAKGIDTKGVSKNASTVGISGISGGSVKISARSQGTKKRKSGGNNAVGRAVRPSSEGQAGTNSKRPRSGSKRKGNGAQAKDKNGRFVKKT